MSQIDVNSVLSQMRALGAQASGVLPAKALPAATGATPAVDFGTVFKQSLGSVVAQQNEAQSQISAFERGDPGADIVKTSIAGQKADLAFRGLVEVRNKLTDAYTTIMNMPV
ncbi:flagellar hook-basal body complex protein FliE [Dyella mobilis]|uniref:Flagellar hook-basal body complex protein FliE n=1 Tax=Dyella mobilis TaxID=1849582 RepID=A0ABS2KA90_9GAMM|nr:flagellar hook-basal body complex protein FliE [Dyella mobilis]MBM7128101.1 flagellar hook-basal body complex protein FliE [Dyella mobilis]GLQ99917.1 flagellar hook-basal body complex protein FliE [Dyella mobilis]